MKKIIVFIFIILFACSSEPKRSSLIDDPCTPFPCKMALEYGRQEYKGKKEMNGVLINWCKDKFNQEEYTKCKNNKKVKK